MARRLLASLALVLVTMLGGPSSGAVAAPPPSDPPVVSANPFIPEEKNLSECVSAVPKPGCGSEERGGWRQTAVFGVVVVGLSFVGWRITRTVRRNRRELETTRGR